MTLEKFCYISQVVAVVAIFGSLAYVAIKAQHW